MVDLSKPYDVLVVGGGNAGLCAAITARQAGASVLVVEHAPRVFRGGNSRHTRNLRAMHIVPTAVLTEAYLEEEYWDDLLRVTKGVTNEHLARMAIRQTQDALPWMESCGVRFQPALSGTLSLSRTNAFFLGGGRALLNAYYRHAEKLGVEVVYDTEVRSVRLEGGRVSRVEVSNQGFPQTLTAKALVVASGGYQANTDWLRASFGPPADKFLIRGTPYAKGRVLKDLIDQGVATVGDPTQGHVVAIDARAPKFDGGIITRLDCVPFSVVLNKNGERFYDEGEDVWPKRYAIWGRLVAYQPDQIGYSIIDSKAAELFMPSVFPAVRGETLEELAGKLDLDPAAVTRTIAGFNAACRPGTFLPTSIEDGCRTEGLTPPKTHWARPIDKPPYYGYPLRPGVTFTYLGVKVDETAQVQLEHGGAVENLFAAGEIMAGNILGQGYTAGVGMAIGTVFGRIAGREAARHAGH